MSKILIVEDDKKIAMGMTVLLKAKGHRVVVAHDALIALTMAKQERPDLVLLDLNMPAGNGLLLAERLQGNSITAGVPMIFVTGSGKPEVREQAAELGASAFLDKPYDAETLVAAVQQALGEPVEA